MSGLEPDLQGPDPFRTTVIMGLGILGIGDKGIWGIEISGLESEDRYI